ncbi:IMPACT family protein [Mucilaginibacter ginsenosidivorax]|uniref:YigZ family protein n=1 Tax=Mucilaginibacter ginsenosidivorax TaxID=862126 RepID=A0A5B8VVD4_9SPHI|nr:YigZ family protein [Mucilaginibacter ginsenosidivorax]QEC74565.1 YigZ family protein [Mucilaginibacter ginsenosidivorax]
MLFDDTYQTIEKPTESIFRDRGSKFLGFAYPISSDNDIKDIVAKLKAEHPKANHHCWAMRLGTDRSVYRVNDDGEPSGTAGRPILNILLSKDVTNILVVVVRYFGGTLLGVPGLINAYKVATEEALKLAVIIQKTVNDIYTIKFDYLQMNDVMRIIKDENLLVLEQQFDNDCSIQLSIRKMQVEQVLGKLGKVAGLKVKYDYSL